MCNVHVGGTCTMHVWGVMHNAHMGGSHAIRAWGVHVQCMRGCMGVYRGVCIIGFPWLPLVVAPSNQQFSG